MPEKFEPQDPTTEVNPGPKELTNQEKLLSKLFAEEEGDPAIYFEKEEERQEEIGRLNEALDSLRPRQQEAIRIRYGLGVDQKFHTLEETGRIMGITKQVVGQHEHKGLFLLGRKLGLNIENASENERKMYKKFKRK